MVSLIKSVVILFFISFLLCMIAFIHMWIVFYPIKDDIKKYFHDRGFNYSYYDGKKSARYREFNKMIEDCYKEINSEKSKQAECFLRWWRFYRKFLLVLFVVNFIVVVFAICFVLYATKNK